VKHMHSPYNCLGGSTHKSTHATSSQSARGCRSNVHISNIRSVSAQINIRHIILLLVLNSANTVVVNTCADSAHTCSHSTRIGGEITTHRIASEGSICIPLNRRGTD